MKVPLVCRIANASLLCIFSFPSENVTFPEPKTVSSFETISSIVSVVLIETVYVLEPFWILISELTGVYLYVRFEKVVEPFMVSGPIVLPLSNELRVAVESTLT